MKLTQAKGVRSLVAGTYAISLPPDRPFVYLDDAAGQRLAELFVPSSIHAQAGRDDTTRLGEWQIDETADEVVLSLAAESSVWAGKSYRLRCQPQRLIYEVEVRGRGQVVDAHYFGGYCSAQPRWGSGFFWSGQQFVRGFNPEPNTDENNFFGPAEGATIDLMGVPLPGRGDWFFTPPPFCFAMQGPSGWLGLGVQAAPGANNYTAWRYHGQRGAFYLNLDFEGHTEVEGACTLPAVVIDFAADEYAALAAHVLSLHAAGSLAPPRPRSAPAWWHEPILCGWGAQCYRAAVENGRASDYSRQPLYDELLDTLAAHDLAPGIVVLDDKWQAAYGLNTVDTDKWPDLRGFVRRQHEAGRKVLLWLKAWDPEGVPVAECVTNAAGQPVAVDPGNPAFEHRLRAAVQQMLSADGYDCDGFKLDFTARVPSGPGLRGYSRLWGLELMKRYLSILYTEAKLAKPDALLMTHTPHPYLAEVLDMIRLNDINKEQDVPRAMRHRARVARIACPAALIDTDNWPIPNKAAWRDYVALQPELGVPSLYYGTHIDSTREPLEASDYALLREAWSRYRAQRGGQPPANAPEKSA